MSYDNWRKRLEIAKLATVAERRAAVAPLKINFSQAGEADEGYYRKPITQKDPSGNGRNTITGWIPVAYYVYEGKLEGVIGAGDQSRNMTDFELGDEQLWSYVVSNPISYETYQAVVERGEPWPESLGLPSAMVRALDEGARMIPYREGGPADILVEFASKEQKEEVTREITKTHNNPPEVLPEVAHAEAIDSAIGAAPKAVSSDAEANLAAGSKNRIAELRLAADKFGRAIYDPLFRAYQAEQKKWSPMVGRAEAEEKALNKLILTWREQERQRIAAEQATADQAALEIEGANERAAQRSIAAGLPEQAPVVEQPEPVNPGPTVVMPTYGARKPREELKKFAVVTDGVEVYKFLAQHPEMVALMQDLATRAVRAGKTVPGTTTREGLI